MSVPTSGDVPNKPITVNAPDATPKERVTQPSVSNENLPSANAHQGSSPAVGILLVEVNKIDCTPKFFQYHEQSHVEYEPF